MQRTLSSRRHAPASRAHRPFIGSRPRPNLAQHRALPAFVPEDARYITEPRAQEMIKMLRRVPVDVPELGGVVDTAVVGPGPVAGSTPDSVPPIVLLNGFDYSGLEFRRLYPLLAERSETWTVDLIGWGFTDRADMVANPERVLGPQEKREHLAAFWRQHVRRPMVLVGASLGGAAALDFAANYPEAVAKVVLIDPQAFVDGIGPMASLPRFLAGLGVEVLRAPALRSAANRLGYFDKERCATEDAVRVGQLHTLLPGWKEGIVSFMLSGGYRSSSALAKAKQVVAGEDMLVLWGRNDEILEPSNAEKLVEALPGARLVWLEQCGHVGHLEQPEAVAEAILEFVGLVRTAVREEVVVAGAQV